MEKKRGVSPLIATVLLVGFTIVMAGLVSTFVIKQTKETFNPDKLLEDSTLCDQMTLGIDVPDKSKLKISGSGSSNYLEGVSVVNKGGYSARGLILNVDGVKDDMSYIFDPELNISAGGKSVKEELRPKAKDGTTPMNYIAPGGSYDFPRTSGNGIYVVNTKFDDPEQTFKIKVYPIIKDFDKDQAVKCAKSVLVIDYKELCNSYGLGGNSCITL